MGRYSGKEVEWMLRVATLALAVGVPVDEVVAGLEEDGVGASFAYLVAEVAAGMVEP